MSPNSVMCHMVLLLSWFHDKHTLSCMGLIFNLRNVLNFPQVFNMSFGFGPKAAVTK